MAEQAPAGGAVTAVEHEQLQRDFTALTDQFAAANEVLSAIGRSAGDPDRVLTTIVESARRLCRSQAAHLYLLENGFYRLIKAVGLSEESIRFISEHPMPIDRQTLVGRVGLDHTTQQIADVLADPDFGRRDLQRVAGFRTTMGAPMLVDDEVVGALTVWRNVVSPFDDREQAIVTAFAGQAAMAVNGVKLVRQLEARGAELARKVGELEALREVGEAVNSSLDVANVLSTIAKHAVRLSSTDGGSIMEYADDECCFLVRGVYRTEPSVVERLRATRIHLDETLVGRAAKLGRPMVLADLGAADLDPHLQVLYDAGWRSVAAVPMLREGQIVGALVVRRKQPGEFSEESLDLLEMFADQSALALLNAQLYRKLEERSAELEVASRHKSEFLASMSHELRTPLNAVLGFSEVLLEQMFGEVNERQEEYLRDIHGSGKHLLELLNEILDLSKVEAGRMELAYSTFELHALLDNTASMLRERAALHGIDVSVEVGPDVGTVYADELRLKQVVLNLMTNAVKFTRDGGSVVVRASRTGSEIEITVTDSGIGVPLEDRERIFESFQQGGRGPSQEEGTGLGLTLSRRIVELLGGKMWLESEVGIGSTFGFSLRSREVVDRPGPTRRPVGDVVVIEDDRPSLDLMTAYLAGADLQVTTAGDGQTGLDAVRRVRPAAVLLDIRLPGIDGWAVLQALKTEPETRRIPVIVVSIVDEQARGAALGAAAYLVKPVSRDALLNALVATGVLGSAEPGIEGPP
ncbi:GAF domain-containing protein [Kribbella orskensis]|uniref:histidine kinase n=1 Tax=Kribbella orskensis TaxID=2512216 RepID=A0ABY2BR65_9ACTN|nr:MULTISPECIES: GAF domain-containing protein [Kribbella]TCN41937.1 GAF domain-containing protein [Kribbella sp. VKM Ac-2500]TCO25815.1 GAF domain-containing protein [Kribbella orskensis]